MNLMKFFSVLLILLSAGFSTIHGQTVYPNCVDGTIYMKVKDASPVSLDPYDNSIPVLNQLISDYGITEIVRPFKLLDLKVQKMYRVKFTNQNQIEELIIELQNLDFIEFAEKAPLYKLNYVPGDYSANKLWGLEKIKATSAWDITKGSGEVKIAIVDNAVLHTHEDLVDNRWVNPGEIPGNLLDDDLNGYADDVYGYDVADGDNDPRPPASTSNSSPFIHGTHCAGITSAGTDNGVGISSIGYSVKIISVKCTPNSDAGNTLPNAYEGLDYAISAGADVVSMSFGSSGMFLTWDILINSAEMRGVLLIAAAGNDNTTDVFYPAGYDYVYAVGATDEMDQKAYFSNYGDYVDVMAPGVGIYSTMVQGGNTYGNLSGTSMACPMVAGLAGLVLSVKTGATPAVVKNDISLGCDVIDAQNQAYIGQLGAGRINALRTLQKASGIDDTDLVLNGGSLMIYPNPSSEYFHIVFPESLDTPAVLSLYNGLGQLILEKQLYSEDTQKGVTIEANKLNKGIYTVAVRTKEVSLKGRVVVW
jgi:serine protease